LVPVNGVPPEVKGMCSPRMFPGDWLLKKISGFVCSAD